MSYYASRRRAWLDERAEDHEMELDPGPPNQEDACPVCDKIDCECPPEPVFTLDHPLKHYFPARHENEHRK